MATVFWDIYGIVDFLENSQIVNATCYSDLLKYSLKSTEKSRPDFWTVVYAFSKTRLGPIQLRSPWKHWRNWDVVPHPQYSTDVYVPMWLPPVWSMKGNFGGKEVHIKQFSWDVINNRIGILQNWNSQASGTLYKMEWPPRRVLRNITA